MPRQRLLTQLIKAKTELLRAKTQQLKAPQPDDGVASIVFGAGIGAFLLMVFHK